MGPGNENHFYKKLFVFCNHERWLAAITMTMLASCNYASYNTKLQLTPNKESGHFQRQRWKNRKKYCLGCHQVCDTIHKGILFTAVQIFLAPGLFTPLIVEHGGNICFASFACWDIPRFSTYCIHFSTWEYTGFNTSQAVFFSRIVIYGRTMNANEHMKWPWVFFQIHIF